MRTPAKLGVRTLGRASRAKHPSREVHIGMTEGNPTPSAIFRFRRVSEECQAIGEINGSEECSQD